LTVENVTRFSDLFCLRTNSGFRYPLQASTCRRRICKEISHSGSMSTTCTWWSTHQVTPGHKRLISSTYGLTRTSSKKLIRYSICLRKLGNIITKQIFYGFEIH